MLANPSGALSNGHMCAGPWGHGVHSPFLRGSGRPVSGTGRWELQEVPKPCGTSVNYRKAPPWGGHTTWQARSGGGGLEWMGAGFQLLLAPLALSVFCAVNNLPRDSPEHRCGELFPRCDPSSQNPLSQGIGLSRFCVSGAGTWMDSCVTMRWECGVLNVLSTQGR